MPTYAYHCPSCETHFTHNTRIAMRDNVKCTHCGNNAERTITTTHIITRSGSSPRPTNMDTSTLPFVGKDGRLYSADGKKVIKS